MKLLHLLLIALLMAAVGGDVSAADGSSTAASAKDEKPSATTAILGGMLDADVPIERRRELAEAFEVATMRDRLPSELYLLGSLYRIGEDNPASPFRKDPVKSIAYLTGAALRGNLGAMEKLAFHYRQSREPSSHLNAAVWGQMFAWYSAIVEEAIRARGLPQAKPNVAPLIAYVMDGFPKRDMPRLDALLREQIETHDTAIRNGINADFERNSRHPLRNARADSCNLTELQTSAGKVKGRWPSYGGAEYVVQFAADGTTRKVWLTDAWPDVDIDRALRVCASGYRVTPFEAESGKNDVAMVPLSIGNPAVKLRDKAN